MELILIIAAGAVAVGVIVYSLIIRYGSLRSLKVVTLLIGLIISVPLLGLCIYVLFAGGQSSEAKMWALGNCGLLFGFWFKSPLKELSLA
jgi:hypothetical protein